jgi:hypothetical protein
MMPCFSSLLDNRRLKSKNALSAAVRREREEEWR